MKTLGKIITVSLIVLTLFLAIPAILGGISLLIGFGAPPVEMLQGSLFNNWIIPSLALMLIVGGSALFAAILLLRKSKYALLASTTAATIIMFFEFVEALTIGSPAGVAFTLQVLYFGVGTLMIVLAMGAWFLELRAESK
jgi:hypothetical protein